MSTPENNDGLLGSPETKTDETFTSVDSEFHDGFENEDEQPEFDLQPWEERVDARPFLRQDMPAELQSRWCQQSERLRIFVCRDNDDMVQAELWVSQKIEASDNLWRCHSIAGADWSFVEPCAAGEGAGADYQFDDTVVQPLSLEALMQWLPTEQEVGPAESSVILFDSGIGAGRRSLPVLSYEDVSEAEKILDTLNSQLVILWQQRTAIGLPVDDIRILTVDSLDVHVRKMIRTKWANVESAAIDKVVSELTSLLRDIVELDDFEKWTEQVFEAFREELADAVEKARDHHTIAESLYEAMSNYATAGDSGDIESLKSHIMDGDLIHNAAAFVATYPQSRNQQHETGVLGLSVQGYDELVAGLLYQQTRKIVDPDWVPIKDKDGNEIQPPRIEQDLAEIYSDDPDKFRANMGLVRSADRTRGLTFSSYNRHRRVRAILFQGRVRAREKMTMRLIEMGALWSSDASVRDFASSAVETQMHEVSTDERVDILEAVLKWTGAKAAITPRIRAYREPHATMRMRTIARLLGALPEDTKVDTANALVRARGERANDWQGIAVLADQIATMPGGQVFPWGQWFTQVISSGTQEDRFLLLKRLLHNVTRSEVMRRRYFEYFAPRICNDALDARERELAVSICITAMIGTVQRLMSRDYDKSWRRRVTESSLINRHVTPPVKDPPGEETKDATGLIPNLVTCSEVIDFVINRTAAMGRNIGGEERDLSLRILLDMVYAPVNWHIRPPSHAFSSTADERRTMKEIRAMQAAARDLSTDAHLDKIRREMEPSYSEGTIAYLETVEGVRGTAILIGLRQDVEQDHNQSTKILADLLAPKALRFQQRLAMEIYALLAGSAREDIAESFLEQIAAHCDGDWVQGLGTAVEDAYSEQDQVTTLLTSLMDRDDRLWVRDDMRERKMLWRAFHREIAGRQRRRSRSEMRDRIDQRRLRSKVRSENRRNAKGRRDE